MTYQKALTYLQTVSPLRITLSGEIGAGKSTFGTLLAEALGMPRIYVGQLMREEAQRRNLSLDEFNTLLETDDSVDRELDALQQQAARVTPRGLFEGRTSWHFVEEPDVRVFLTVDPQVAAQRVFDDTNNPLRDTYRSVDEIIKANTKRKNNEIKRYEGYYGIDVYNPANFDLVIDTTHTDAKKTLEQGVIVIAEFLKKH